MDYYRQMHDQYQQQIQVVDAKVAHTQSKWFRIPNRSEYRDRAVMDRETGKSNMCSVDENNAFDMDIFGKILFDDDDANPFMVQLQRNTHPEDLARKEKVNDCYSGDAEGIAKWFACKPLDPNSNGRILKAAPMFEFLHATRNGFVELIHQLIVENNWNTPEFFQYMIRYDFMVDRHPVDANSDKCNGQQEFITKKDLSTDTYEVYTPMTSLSEILRNLQRFRLLDGTFADAIYQSISDTVEACIGQGSLVATTHSTQSQLQQGIDHDTFVQWNPTLTSRFDVIMSAINDPSNHNAAMDNLVEFLGKYKLPEKITTPEALFSLHHRRKSYYKDVIALFQKNRE